MTMNERRIPSSDGEHELYCRVYVPEGDIKGLFHVVHGMVEHISRYDSFMRTITEHGYVCYGFDNLGHGHTAKDESELGYIGGWQYLVRDVQNVSKQMKEEFGASLPCYLMGHSMGSFISRCAANPAIWGKAIFMGTAGPNPVSKAGLAMLKIYEKTKGARSYAPLMNKMIFGAYANQFKEEQDYLAWLSNDRAVRDSYRADPYCGFSFTISAMQDLIRLQSLCNSKTWFEGVSAALPILLVSGSEDPVGNNGKGVTKVYETLRQNGKNVRMKLYEGCRHEILNDLKSDEVKEDILSFISE